MRFCEPHWAALQQAITNRGLGAFVASGGVEVTKRVAEQQERGITVSNFEPLAAAHMAIVGRLVEVGGLSPLIDNEDGSERCPICFANAEHEFGCSSPDCDYSYDHFVEFAADDQLASARLLGLVPQQ